VRRVFFERWQRRRGKFKKEGIVLCVVGVPRIFQDRATTGKRKQEESMLLLLLFFPNDDRKKET